MDRNDFARSLRRSLTDAERRLWSRLRDRRLAGCKFRRQHTVAEFVVDFVCLERGLIIELDGGQHPAQARYDARRTKALEEHGFTVMRFWNDDVLARTDAVLESISRALRATQ